MAIQASPKGLENVVVASTALSAIDGTAGELMYTGYSIHDLAAHTTFEDIVHLLWHGKLPTPEQRHGVAAALESQRALSDEEMALVQALPRSGHGMDALRSAVSMLAQLDEAADGLDPANVERIGLRVAAKMPTMIAAWHRLRTGQQPVAPKAGLGHAANVLYMLHGNEPDATAVKAFDTYLVLLAEHGLNASTFAARVAIGAGADVYCALVGAIGTLKGVAHGGANQKAMELFLAIGTPENTRTHIKGMLNRRERLMGIGHRIYKVEDPRVRHLRTRVVALGEASGDQHWQRVAETVSDVVAGHPFFVERKLAPNVEFYSAPLLHALGIPLDMFTCAFTFSRSVGWLGHIREQLADNRLIRPKADYNGPARRELPAAYGN